MKFICFLLLAVVFSCTKIAHKQKLLQGNWDLDVVRIEDGEGFMFYDSSAIGNFTFEPAQLTGIASYTYSYFGQYDVSDSVVFNQSSCALSTNGEVLLIARDTDTLQAKIIMLTKKQLTFEYYDYLQYRLKRFSCTRNL